MNIDEWWPRLDSDAQAWLIAHNGEAVTPEVVRKIVAAGGAVTSSVWRAAEPGQDDFHLSDEAVDWIETTANNESQ